jgi:endonuclease I
MKYSFLLLYTVLTCVKPIYTLTSNRHLSLHTKTRKYIHTIDNTCLYTRVPLIQQHIKPLYFTIEHVIPQSYLKSINETKTCFYDLHLIYKCLPSVNTFRSNKPYTDNITTSSSYFYVCNDITKGIISRTCLYYLHTYKPKNISLFYNKVLSEELIYKWNILYPVSYYEKHRHALIYSIQRTNNPYIIMT